MGKDDEAKWMENLNLVGLLSHKDGFKGTRSENNNEEEETLANWIFTARKLLSRLAKRFNSAKKVGNKEIGYVTLDPDQEELDKRESYEWRMTKMGMNPVELEKDRQDVQRDVARYNLLLSVEWTDWQPGKKFRFKRQIEKTTGKRGLSQDSKSPEGAGAGAGTGAGAGAGAGAGVGAGAGTGAGADSSKDVNKKARAVSPSSSSSSAPSSGGAASEEDRSGAEDAEYGGFLGVSENQLLEFSHDCLEACILCGNNFSSCECCWGEGR
jgi:hypothetical protein